MATDDEVLNRLMRIEEKLDNFTRVDERVNSHNDTLKRYGNRLDDHAKQIGEIEKTQAHSKGFDKGNSTIIAHLMSLVALCISAVATYFSTRGH